MSNLSSSNLEVVAPVTSNVEFKYTWPIHGFLKQVKESKHNSYSEDDLLTHCVNAQDKKTTFNSAGGLDSMPFEINVNGVQTKWNLSIRFWTGEDGERLANPFVLCLNMLSCSVEKPLEVRLINRNIYLYQI